MSGLPFSCCPVSPTSRFSSQEFRVLLCRRFWLPGHPFDAFGHHRPASTVGRWGFSLESGRVSVNVFIRDFDITILGVMDN